MANTINRLAGNPAQSAGTSRTGQPSRRDASPGPSSALSEGGDQVQITNTAAQLSAIGQGLSAASPIDAARVARISQALADGTYSISAQQIASGLVQSENALAQIGS